VVDACRYIECGHLTDLGEALGDRRPRQRRAGYSLING
jgi:hypothetical protein